MKKYRIAIYHTDFGAGGVEKVMITYANQLAEQGFEVYAIETRQGILDNQFSAKVKDDARGTGQWHQLIKQL